MERSIADLNSIQQKFYDGVKNTSLVQSIFAGRMNRRGYIRFLIDAHYYAQHSPKVMTIAGERCRGKHPELAEYLFHHSGEETGHDEWARLDLRDLGMSAEEISLARPSVSASALVGYTHYLAAVGNPVALYGWMYVLEALGDNLGPSLASLIRDQLGIEGDGLRFIAGHAASDHGHAADLAHQLKHHVRSDADYDDICYAARVVSRLYTGILQEAEQE